MNLTAIFLIAILWVALIVLAFAYSDSKKWEEYHRTLERLRKKLKEMEEGDKKEFDKTLNNAIRQNRIDDTTEGLIAEREAIAMLTESLIDVIGLDRAQQIIDKLEL